MTRRPKRGFSAKLDIALALIFSSCFVTAGCSNRPSAISPPDIDPQALAAAAVKQYDQNADGVIDKKELLSAPSLRFSRERIDVNSDYTIDAKEIAEFAQKHWIENAAGIIRVQCMVTLGGRPLHGATVTLEPEAFMAGAVNPASGVTSGGTVPLDVSDEDRPHPNAHGVQNGLYLVRISKIVNGRETIPAKYNNGTVLGCEVADRASYMPGPVVFNL